MLSTTQRQSPNHPRSCNGRATIGGGNSRHDKGRDRVHFVYVGTPEIRGGDLPIPLLAALNRVYFLAHGGIKRVVRRDGVNLHRGSFQHTHSFDASDKEGNAPFHELHSR